MNQAPNPLDAAAWEAVMRSHNRRLFRVARALLRDDAEAEDALQDAYLSAFRAMPGFRADASLATWLNRIVVNACMSRLRRRARRNTIAPIVPFDPLADGLAAQEDAMHDDPAGADADTPDHALGRAQLRTLLEREIDALPPAFRSVFVMRALEDMSVEEVAELLHVPPATVRSRFFRARALLREALARDIDFALEDAFAFAGTRCDRIVAGVLRALGVAQPPLSPPGAAPSPSPAA